MLDVGAGNGFFAFELERRGGTVVALDLAADGPVDWTPEAARPPEWLPGQFQRNFELAHSALGSSVEYRRGSIYDLSIAEHGIFDVVFCGSLLLHLLHPMQALFALRSVTRELLIIETGALTGVEELLPGEPLLRFGSWDVEQELGVPRGTARTYWRLTGPALQAMLEHAGFRDVDVLPQFELPPIGHHALVAHARP